MSKKKVSGKVTEVKNLETSYCNWYVDKMAKNVTLQDDEKFCIFVTKDKANYYFHNVLHQVFTGFLKQKRFGISYLSL